MAGSLSHSLILSFYITLHFICSDWLGSACTGCIARLLFFMVEGSGSNCHLDAGFRLRLQDVILQTHFRNFKSILEQFSKHGGWFTYCVCAFIIQQALDSCIVLSDYHYCQRRGCRNPSPILKRHRSSSQILLQVRPCFAAVGSPMTWREESAIA